MRGIPIKGRGNPNPVSGEVSTLYRVSLVHMWYAIPPSRDTPVPFAELRVFFFLVRKPTMDEIAIAKRGMRKILKGMLYVFSSITDAVDAGRADFKEEMGVDEVRGRIRTEIRGFEVEAVDLDEVLEWFRRPVRTLRILENYRYARFYDIFGEIKAEYDEWDIRKHEDRLRLERVRELGARITQIFGEIMTWARMLREATARYERYLEELERFR